MSSTPSAGPRISVSSSLPSNGPSSFAPPSYIPSSPSSGVDTIALLTSVTTSPTTPVTTTPHSKQSQQPLPASQTTMTITTVVNTAASTPASPSVPESLTIPSTTLRMSSASSSMPSAITATSSDDGRPTTSASETPVQSMTSVTTGSPIAIQSSTSLSPTSDFPSTTAPSARTTAAPLTSNTPLTTISSSSPSNIPAQSSSLARTAIPLTTVLESTTIFITSTNSQGQVMTSVPPVVTEVITTTGSGGMVTTVTQAVVNPTLAPNNITTGGSSFFTDTGAVVGVFVVVGLASASIMMWILFAIRRRQHMRRVEQDTAVEAAVAAAGLNRAPLDDDAEDGSPTSPNTYHQFSSETGQRSTSLGLRDSQSLPISARLSEVLDDLVRDNTNSHLGRPVEHHASIHAEGYIPARTTSPSPRAENCTDDLRSSRERKSSYGHTPTYSAGSFEPLLANYAHNLSDQDAPALTIEPQRNRSSQHLGSSLTPYGYSSDGSPERGSRATSLKGQNSSGSSVLLRDEEDYARYVLTVRNVPDNLSQHSS